MDTALQSNLMLYNAAIVWMIAIVALVVGIRILKTQKKDKKVISFGWFWFIAGVSFFVFGSRLFAFWAGYPGIDKSLFPIAHAVMALSMVGLIYHITLRTFPKEKIANIVMIVFFLFVEVATIFIFSGGIEGTPLVSEWGSEYGYSPLANTMIKFLFGVLMIFIIYHLFAFLFRWLTKKAVFQTSEFLSILSIMLFFLGVSFDALAKDVQYQWLLFLGRIITLISVLIAYFCYPEEEVLRNN